MKNVIVGTAGHIDHGKSALVEALTGTHPDRLEEEKRRGITIDLGFAFLDLEDVRIGFVDVPGHERFVKNMLAGVSGFDLVLLVIAADESIKPQTREHFDICRLLGIPRGLTVITKADLVDADTLELIGLEVEDFLRGSFLDGAPIVTASARTGRGLDQLKEALLRVARDAPPKDATRAFRLPIDRVFPVKGFGAVVTGTLVAGSVTAELEAELFPGGKRARIRGVQSGGKAMERAVAGQRTALNLAGVDLNEVTRGMTLAAPGLFEATKRMDVRLMLLSSARALKNHAQVHLHLGTSECVAEVGLLDRAQIAPGESCFAQLHLREPVLALPGDRFIVRQFSPVVTIGGGAVLNNRTSRKARKDPRLLALLEAFESGSRDEILLALCDVEGRCVSGKEIVSRTGWLPTEAREIAMNLERAGKVQVLGEGEDDFNVAGSELITAYARGLREAVEEFHTANSLVPGISKEELRERLAGGEELFRAALEQSVARGVLAVSGDVVKRAGREIELQADEARAMELIEEAFAVAGLTVPPIEQVLGKLPVETKRAQKILQILVREKVLIKVAEDLIFHRDAIARLRELLAGHKRTKGEQLSVPEFKELSGVTRKYAIPLLEYLDRERVTRRAGDVRIIL